MRGTPSFVSLGISQQNEIKGKNKEKGFKFYLEQSTANNILRQWQ
jgi:hypothetical protein